MKRIGHVTVGGHAALTATLTAQQHAEQARRADHDHLEVARDRPAMSRQVRRKQERQAAKARVQRFQPRDYR
jgi:hypothetical protein